MRKYITVLLLFVSLMVNAQSWKLVWSDEFDGPSINSNSWTYDQGGTGWGNNELEYYTNRQENAKIDNGNLLIIAKKESYGGKSYTSARLKTQGLQNFNFGKIEARIKLPLGQGIWPAFWMLGKNITESSFGWPKCGEIDIMEHINNEAKVYSTIHWDNNGHASYGGNTPCNVTNYHVYSIEWNTSSIKSFLDGNKFWEANIANGINSTNEFQLPFFIILNLAVGGNWPGNPDATTAFPDTMFVDYVRVSQLATGIEKNKINETPSNFSLEQNYPNPFNPETTISYQLSAASHVTLKVYNALGMEVAVLVDEYKQPGVYHSQFTIGNSTIGSLRDRFPSGIYFYQLRAGDFVSTKKMQLLK